MLSLEISFIRETQNLFTKRPILILVLVKKLFAVNGSLYFYFFDTNKI